MPHTRVTRGWFGQLVDGAFALGALALVLFSIGVAGIMAGIWGIATRDDASRITDTNAMASIDDIGQSLCVDMAAVVRPAMDRTQAIAHEPEVIAALLGGSRVRQTEACNQAIADSKVLDAVALFDRQGKIVAINTNYASGKPIASQRIDRILQMNFDDRDIIQRCVRNTADDHVLEFQTTCDITPALFDSTGLSVAYSVPVRDPESGQKIGVISSRLRFERLTDLIKTRSMGGETNAIEFVTDRGGYFSEEINSGREAAPIPQSVLAAIVAPMAAGTTDYCFTHSGHDYLSLFKLKEFVTIGGGGIQVMVMADESWLAAQARQARTFRSEGMIAAGLLFLLLTALINIYGITPLRGSARSRATLAAVVEYSDDAIISQTLDGRILSWNDAAERMFGYHADESLGRDSSILQLPGQAGKFVQIRRAVEFGQHLHHFDTEVVRKDGRRLAVSLSISPIKDLAGKAIGISKIFRDVSDRKQIETENQCLAADRDRLLHRLQLQIDRMPLAYVLFDAEFRVTDWNPAAESIFGYTRAEMRAMATPCQTLVPRSFWPKAGELLNRIQYGDMSANSVNENVTKDGRTITCEWFNTPLVSDDGGFGGLLCLARDITERKKAEQALRESQERFELAIRGSNDGVGDWNFETGAAYWSPRLCEMLGYTQAEFGSTFDSFSSKLHTDDSDRVLGEISERTRLHEPATAEFRLLTKSGAYCWVQGRGQAVYDQAGMPFRFAGAITDITERKQMEAELAQRAEQLRQSHKLEAVGSLAGGIAHEFNNLLQVIRGYGQYAMEGLPPADQRYQDLEQVIIAADRAASLTRGLLGFSRHQVLEPVSFDHQEVVRDLVRLLRPLIGEHIGLDVDLATDMIPIHADRGLMQQMLLNLCINARDSMPAGGRLTLKTYRVDLSEKYWFIRGMRTSIEKA